jgi:transposase
MRPEVDGSLSAVKRRCSALRRARTPREEDVAIPVVSEPGDVAQVDFGSVGKLFDPDAGKLRPAWIFVMVLGYSRRMAVRIVFDQKVPTWLRVHRECFEELCGVPRTIVPDNLKAAVIRSAFGASGECSLNRSYRDAARHYGFVINPTPPRSQEKKGKVESAVRYVKSNFFLAHAPHDIRDARRGLQLWVEEVANKREHGTTGEQPAVVFEAQEKALLSSLPDSAFELLECKQAKVHTDSHVVYRGELYSVPWQLIGKQMDLRVTTRSVQIYHQDEPVYVHDRVRPGQRSTVEAHLPESRAYMRHRSRTHWQSLADAIGAPVGELIRRVFEADDVLSQLRSVQHIVNHLQQFPPERACAACQRALHFDNLTYRGIKNILRQGLDLEPMPEQNRLLSGHWQNKPRYSRVRSKKAP